MLALMNFILLIAVGVNTGLGFFIFFKDFRNRINRAFAGVFFCAAQFAFCIFMWIQSWHPVWALWWLRLGFVGPSIIAGLVVYLAIIFPEQRLPVGKFQYFLMSLPSAVFVALSLTPLIVRHVEFPFVLNVEYGPAHIAFTAFIVAYFSLAFYILFIKYFTLKEDQKLQVWYVLFGMGIAAVAGVTSNLILPLLGVRGMVQIGPASLLIMDGFIFYSIVRFKLLNIDDFLSRGVAFLSFAALVVGTFVILSSGNLFFLFPFYVILANLTLGSIVFFQNMRNNANRFFILSSLGICGWLLGVLMMRSLSDPSQIILWRKVTYTLIPFLASFVHSFTLFFPKERENLSQTQVSMILLIPFLFPILVWNNLIVSPTTAYPWYEIGPAYPLFVIHLLTSLVLTLANMLRSYFTSGGLEKTQLRYLFLGGFVTILVGVGTNVVLPVMGIVELSILGPMSSVFLTVFSAYAVIRHRMMSIELVIQRGLVYGVTTAIIMGIYAVIVILSEQMFREVVGYTSYIVTGGAAITIAILYQPIIRFLQGVTDKVFFKKQYDYQKTITRSSSAIASVIKMEDLTMLIISTFTDVLMVSEISFLLYSKEKKRFRSVEVELEGASKYRIVEIDERSPIIAYLKRTRDILVRDEIDRRIYQSDSDLEKTILNELREEMDRIGVPLWVPVISKDELVAIITSGNKLSQDIFTVEDMELLRTLANQTAVALENVNLYEQILSMKTYNEDIFQSMKDGLLATDLGGHVVTFNSMAEKLTGYSTSEIVDKDVYDVWKKGAISSAVYGTLRGGKYSNYEANLIRKDGGVIPLSISTAQLRDSQGKSMGILVMMSDLSGVKELERKVRQSDKLAALGTMAAGMAHEIKNPLSSMKVLTQLMPIKYNDEEFRKRFTEIMPREINRVDRIVESLLGFARATAPKLSPVKIESVIEEAISFFKEDAEARGVKIIKQYSPVPDVVADADQIIQVFSNLILNAIQAMPQGGELKVSIEEGKKKEGILEDILITVSDTGQGISRDYLEKLFDPFFTTKHGGTGLGLTISHSIVEGHKGHITVESEIGKGTTFRVSLPVGA